MLDFLKRELGPKFIEATVCFPKEVMDKFKVMKENGENINDDSAFIRYDSFKPPVHAGFVELMQDKRMKFYYATEGNWFVLKVTDLQMISGSQFYPYNYEDNFIKAEHLKDINILEYGQLNENGDGMLIQSEKGEYTLVYNTKKMSICDSNIKTIELNLKTDEELNQNIEKVEFLSEENDLDYFETHYHQKINSRKTVKGKITLKDGEIEFEVYKRSIFNEE